MDTALLATKLQVPPLPNPAVCRDRLIDSLEEEILHYKLLLISAPAGYGKTTLLSQWTHASRFPAAWFLIEKADNDLERFLRYLFTGWQRIYPEVDETPLGLLLGGISPDREAVLAAFINAADNLAGPMVFVLDDFHLIEDPSIHQALTFLLDHLPPSLHFVLAGRGEPQLPLPRYRARNEMLDLRASDLRFLPEETQEFLRARIGIDLSLEELAPLQAGTEGWVAGLQLASLTLRQGPAEVERKVLSGRHRFIADYLNEEVLADLPDDYRRVLLQTSILDRLCGPLVEAVTGKGGGQQTLETLERENLFLQPLDDNREWFRYHQLFADFLREALKHRNPETVVELHRRAAGWYLAHDLPEQAFRHAVDGGDVGLILQIFERYVQAMLMAGEFKLLKGWLEVLPQNWFSDYPLIGFVRTGFLLFTGQLEACVRSIEAVEQRLESTSEEDTASQFAQASAIRCSIACFQNDMARAEVFASQAFRDLPAEDRFFRSILYGSLGDTYRHNGRWREARDCYLRLLDFVPPSANRLQAAHVFGALADLDLRRGHLKGAADYWGKALEAIQERENWGRLPLPLTGWVYIRTAELLYEWNELAKAWDYLSRGLERAKLGGDARALIAGYLNAGRLKLVEGDLTAAEDYLELARPQVESAHFSYWISRFERFQLDLWLALDRLRTAIEWFERKSQEEKPEEGAESELARLSAARILIVKGDQPSLERAMELLESLSRVVEVEGRMGVEIEALALQALAHSRRGDNAEAMESLERALRLAEPEGYIRRFADLGLPMGRLLQEAQSRKIMPAYVERLLAAFGSNLLAFAPTEKVLPEPLTRREEEILKLLAAGLTNREIAEELVISPETVKKHASSIYGKLGVRSRTQAAARARTLDLLN